jgi:hypothetical protein
MSGIGGSGAGDVICAPAGMIVSVPVRDRRYASVTRFSFNLIIDFG